MTTAPGSPSGETRCASSSSTLGEAQARGADTVLTTGAVQSNFVRVAAAGARQLGMDMHIQLEDRVAPPDDLYYRSGNVLLDRLLGATLHPLPAGADEKDADEKDADEALDRLAQTLAATGRKPYVIHIGVEHPPIGGLGYVVAAGEILEQARAQGVRFDAVICASGSGLTHAGTLVGMRALGERAPVHGIAARVRQAQPGGRGRDLDGGAAGSPATRPRVHRQGDGGTHRPRAHRAHRGREPRALRAYRGTAGRVLLCDGARTLACVGSDDDRIARPRVSPPSQPQSFGRDPAPSDDLLHLAGVQAITVQRYPYCGDFGPSPSAVMNRGLRDVSPSTSALISSRSLRNSVAGTR